MSFVGSSDSTQGTSQTSGEAGKVVLATRCELVIHPKAWAMIRTFTEIAKEEISGLGLAYIEGNSIYVPEVFLPKQKNTGANSELDEAALSALMVKLEREGVGAHNLKFWWHFSGGKTHHQVQ